MKKKKAFIFPGQGAQKPFMGKTFYDEFFRAKEVYQKAEDLLSMHISSKIFSSDEAFLTSTDFCQIALFVTSMAIHQVIKSQMPELKVDIAAGLSLGEYSALVAAEKVTFDELLPVIHKRGRFMHEASMKSKQAMACMIGLKEENIPKKYEIANINSLNQVVISGSLDQIELAKVELKGIGARRVVGLNVSGAFHSSYMNSAKEKLAPFIESCLIKDSSIDLLMNVTGKIVSDPKLIKKHLINQVSSQTRWLDCVIAMEENSVEYVEIGASQLKGINRRIGIKHSHRSIETVKDLEELYETV